jgi:hypothetical protein
MVRPGLLEKGLRDFPVLRARFRRLTTDARMKFVWRQLERELREIGGREAHPDYVAAHLRGYLYGAITADHNIAYWETAPSTQIQRAKMSRISLLAGKLMKLLGEPEYKKFTLWNALDAAVPQVKDAPISDQELLNRLAGATRGRHWSATGVAIGEPSFLPAIALLGDLPLQLRGLALLAKHAAQKKVPQSYRKRKAKPLITILYREYLARILQGSGLRARPFRDRRAGFSIYRIIATTTNVALGLSSSDELTSNTVRKSAVRKSSRQ